MLHAGLDLSREKVDVCLFSDAGEIVGEFPVPPDADGLRALVCRVGPSSRGCTGTRSQEGRARFHSR